MSNIKALQKHLIYKVRYAASFLDYVWANFKANSGMYRASALTFTTLLALVPLMSVTITLFSIFPAFSNLLEPIQHFIFENFVPATGLRVQKYLMSFTLQASKLSVFGISVLIITTALLMVTIEQAMNKIWHVPNNRRGVSAFLVYWTCLSLTPILLGLSVLFSSYLFSLPLWAPESISNLLVVAPAIIAFIGFSMLYIIVPNCQVEIRHAVSGAFIATVLFEITKVCFTWYLKSFNTYELIYGAFSLVPLFFIWIYWLWIITLLSAEMAHAFSSFPHLKKGETYDSMTHAIRWLYHLYQAQKEGEGLSLHQLIDLDKKPYDLPPEDLLDVFIKRNLVIVSRNKIRLSLNLEHLNFLTLNERLSLPYPTKAKVTDDKLDEKIDHYFKERAKRIEDLNTVSLATWFNQLP